MLKVFAEKTVVDDVFDDTFEISLEDARKINMAYELGDIIEEEVTPSSFGRIAAQLAKQVVVQRIREAERGVIYDRFIEKENELMTGVVLRQERGSYYLDLGNTEGSFRLRRSSRASIMNRTCALRCMFWRSRTRSRDRRSSCPGRTQASSRGCLN